MKNMKKVVSLILTAVLSLSFCVPAFAAEIPETTTIVSERGTKITMTETEEQYVVRVDYTNGEYEVSIRDNDTYQVETKFYDANGNVVRTAYADASIMQHLEQIPAPTDYYQHTFSNYEYDVDESGTYESWTCRRGDDYKTRINRPGTVTAANLRTWKQYVEDINDGELDLIKEIGVAAVEIVIDIYFLNGASAALTFLGAGTAAQFILVDLSDNWDLADELFDNEL